MLSTVRTPVHPTLAVEIAYTANVVIRALASTNQHHCDYYVLIYLYYALPTCSRVPKVSLCHYCSSFVPLRLVTREPLLLLVRVLL
jgi:hypothetical protein